MKLKNTINHDTGSKLIKIAKRFFFNRNTQDKMEPTIIATGYKEMAKTNETLAAFTPLSKLINDNPQMTNHGNKESIYKIWLMIKYDFISSSYLKF